MLPIQKHGTLPPHEEATLPSWLLALWLSPLPSPLPSPSPTPSPLPSPLPSPSPLPPPLQSPSPLLWAIAAVAVTNRRRHLCHVALSHCCRRCPSHQTLLSPTPLDIAVAIAVGHHRPHAVDHFRELLPWRSKNVFEQLKQRMLTLFYFIGTVGSLLIEAGSLTRCQAAIANTSVGR